MTVEGREILNEWKERGQNEKWPGEALVELQRMIAEGGETEQRCIFEHWNREAGAIEPCGKFAPVDSLCPEHNEFVKDATGMFSQSKKAHPADFNWIAKARVAYGIKGMTLASMGKPSDAGKKPAPFNPADIAEWNMRRVAELYAKPDPVQIVAEPVRERTVEEIHADNTPFESVTVPVAQYTREAIERACRRIMEAKEKYKGNGISPIVWSIGFRVVYQNRPASDKQIAAVQAIVSRQPDKYRPIFAT
jgi:hypothetical protein